MPKGFFSQTVCLLTDGQTSLDQIKSALQQDRFKIARETPANANWQLAGPTLILPFRPQVNGYASVDLVDHPWPDAMGDPKSDVDTFGAWSMGYFGLFTFPRSLQRAQQHAYAWVPGRTVPNGHRSFIRIRISYVFGGKPDAPILPQDYDPLAELAFLNRIVISLFKLDGILCYFNPNGEVLSDHANFFELWDGCRIQQKIPMQLWTNVRFFSLNNELGFMDTVGNAQLDIPDVEAIFAKDAYDPGAIDYYLRNVSLYLHEIQPRSIQTGEAIDGPEETNLSWIVEALNDSTITPPRRVLRLYPKSLAASVKAALTSARGQKI